MKKYSALLLFVLLAACNGNKDKEQNATDTAVTNAVISNDTQQRVLPDTAVNSNEPVSSSWYNAGFKDSVDFTMFIIQFQKWVYNKTMDSIESHIAFPLKNIRSAKQLREQYDSIFTDSIKTEIIQQIPDRLFHNQQGAMIANGKIWFNEKNGKFLVTAINK